MKLVNSSYGNGWIFESFTGCSPAGRLIIAHYAMAPTGAETWEVMYYGPTRTEVVEN
jgi:hypothetical protein